MIETRYTPRVRTHRLIAGVRVISSGLTAVALAVLPGTVARHGRWVLAMELAYFAFAVALFLRIRRRPQRITGSSWMLTVDTAVVLMLLAETRGPSSPFLLSALFVAWAAAYLVGNLGTIAVTATLLAGWIAMAVIDGVPNQGRPLFILRTLMIVALPGCLAWRRSYDERNRIELAKLAAWPRGDRPREEVLRGVLECAADLTRATRVVLSFEEEEEPWVNVAECDREGFRFLRRGPDSVPIESSVIAHDGTISTPVRGANVSGRLDLFGCRNATADDLTLAEVIAGLIAAELDRLVLLDKIRQSAATDERMRLARSFHDGLLQSMTAVSVQLATIENAFQRDPRSALDTLANLRQIVAADQSDLRDFVTNAREEEQGKARPAIETSLRALADGFERRWGIHAHLEIDPLPDDISDDVVEGIYSIVHEGFSNAAKHAGAMNVQARVGVEGSKIAIGIDDDGRGFPFAGRYDLAMLTRQSGAPVALRARVESLRGDLVIESSSSGARLRIRLPM